MKILYVITCLATGGAERALYNLLHGGLSARFDNHVISLSDKGTVGPQIEALGIPVTTLDMRGGRPSLSGFTTLNQTVKGFRPDLIQGWMYHGNLAATLAHRLSAKHTVLAWNIRQSLYNLDHEKPMTRQVIRLNRFFSSSPDALLYNSQLSQKQHETFGFSSINEQVIPNGINIGRFSFSSALRKRVRSELGIPADVPAVGHVARLHPMKDHPTILRATVDLALQYPETHFLFSGRDVLLSNKTLEQLVPIQVRDRFHLLGERNDVHALMSAMDIFCQSSWSEAFPNVLGEAMSTGVPCVATNVGDSAAIVGDTGIMVPPQDQNALAAGIARLLTMPFEERHTLGVNARARIETNYSLGLIAQKYTTLYEKLISNT